MITKTKKGYKIKFNKQFYSETIIQKGLKDFEEVLTGTIKKEIVILNLKKQDANIPYEFCNYVFNLIK